jgi:hypothetical protein
MMRALPAPTAEDHHLQGEEKIVDSTETGQDLDLGRSENTPDDHQSKIKAEDQTKIAIEIKRLNTQERKRNLNFKCVRHLSLNPNQQKKSLMK